MKRLFILLLAVLLAGCTASEPEILFDEASEGIISVILKDTNDGTIHYDVIGPDGLRQPSQPFDSDPVEILTADEGCFENYVENQPPNRLVKTRLLDESGAPVENNETLQRIFELASQQEHVILGMQVLRLDGHYFVTMEWNVNFWDPHAVFYYNSDTDTLDHLFTYDATRVIGLKILNLPRS